MRINEPRPPLVGERGHCKSVRDAHRSEFSYPQETLPATIAILLCMLDGAERRHKLKMRWLAGSAFADQVVKFEKQGEPETTRPRLEVRSGWADLRL
jgi:hypothetical protein